MNTPLETAIRLARHPVNDLERYELGGEMIPHLQPGENVDTGALRVLADEVERSREMRTTLREHAAATVDYLQGEVLVLKDERASLLTAMDNARHWNQKLSEDITKARTDHKESIALVENLIHENRTLRGPVPPIKPGEVDVPREIVEAAERVKVWMETNGLREWQLCGICDRRFAGEVENLRAENGRQAATIAALRAEVKPPSVSIVTTNTGRAFGRHFQTWMESKTDPVPDPD